MNKPVSWLAYAFRFMQLPLGLFGVAVASATLPVISREAGAGRIDEFRDTLSRSLGLVFLLTIPSTVGLLVLSQPLIGVVYERGRFTASDTEQTALALAFYCLGLVGYACTKVLAPAFYAMDNVRIPMMVSMFSIALNYTLNFVYIEILGWGRLGISTIDVPGGDAEFDPAVCIHAIAARRSRRQLAVARGNQDRRRLCRDGSVLLDLRTLHRSILGAGHVRGPPGSTACDRACRSGADLLALPIAARAGIGVGP